MEGETAGTNWRTFLVIAALALVVWWVWRERGKKRRVKMQDNVSPPPVPPPGVPLTLTEKMAQVVDTAIPVVMTSGTSAAYDDTEVVKVANAVLARLNALGEKVALIKVTSASKTVDSYKTVSYDLVVSAYDPRANVGVLLAISVLVPVSGKMYVRTLKMYHEAEDKTPGPRAASDPVDLAPFEGPLDVLSSMKLNQK